MEECRKDITVRKGVKGLLLVGQEKVPCGFGLRTRDPSDTANDYRNQRKAYQPSTDYWEELGAT